MKKIGWARLVVAVGVVIFLLVSDRSPYLLPTLLAALFHEGGHLTAAALLRVKLRGVSLGFFGARLRVYGRLMSYGEEWILAAAGPLFSLFGAALSALFWKFGPFFVSFSCASLLLGLLNLAPIRSFDGGRMLESFLCAQIGPEKSSPILFFSSVFSLFLTFATASYLFLRAGEGVGFFFFSAGLFFRFLEDEKNEIF